MAFIQLLQEINRGKQKGNEIKHQAKRMKLIGGEGYSMIKK